MGRRWEGITMNKYFVKVYDSNESVMTFVCVNHDICLQQYETDVLAVVAAINLYDELNNSGEDMWSLEVGVYVKTLTLGEYQQVGYIEYDGEYSYEECF